MLEKFQTSLEKIHVLLEEDIRSFTRGPLRLLDRCTTTRLWVSPPPPSAVSRTILWSPPSTEAEPAAPPPFAANLPVPSFEPEHTEVLNQTRFCGTQDPVHSPVALLYFFISQLLSDLLLRAVLVFMKSSELLLVASSDSKNLKEQKAG